MSLMLERSAYSYLRSVIYVIVTYDIYSAQILERINAQGTYLDCLFELMKSTWTLIGLRINLNRVSSAESHTYSCHNTTEVAAVHSAVLCMRDRESCLRLVSTNISHYVIIVSKRSDSRRKGNRNNNTE